MWMNGSPSGAYSSISLKTIGDHHDNDAWPTRIFPSNPRNRRRGVSCRRGDQATSCGATPRSATRPTTPPAIHFRARPGKDDRAGSALDPLTDERGEFSPARLSAGDGTADPFPWRTFVARRPNCRTATTLRESAGTIQPGFTAGQRALTRPEPTTDRSTLRAVPEETRAIVPPCASVGTEPAPRASPPSRRCRIARSAGCDRCAVS